MKRLSHTQDSHPGLQRTHKHMNVYFPADYTGAKLFETEQKEKNLMTISHHTFRKQDIYVRHTSRDNTSHEDSSAATLTN